jgi:hypothetical protein
MCKTKDEASTKMDRLIASMDRLSAALEGNETSRVARRPISDVIMTTVKDAMKASGRFDRAFRLRVRASEPKDWIDLPELKLVGPADG